MKIKSMVLAGLVVFSAALVARAADGQSKNGPIMSVDAKAKTFVVKETRELTFTSTDKTTYTLDGKESTFDDSLKVGNKAKVSYTKDGETRTATKVEVTTKEK